MRSPYKIKKGLTQQRGVLDSLSGENFTVKRLVINPNKATSGESKEGEKAEGEGQKEGNNKVRDS